MYVCVYAQQSHTVDFETGSLTVLKLNDQAMLAIGNLLRSPCLLPEVSGLPPIVPDL